MTTHVEALALATTQMKLIAGVRRDLVHKHFSEIFTSLPRYKGQSPTLVPS